MSKTTRATLALKAAGVQFALHAYNYDPDSDRVGLQAAEALGVSPDRLLKTLMTRVDGRPVCAIIAADREVSMRRLAAAVGGKTAEMMPAADAERATGYHVGGISPFGQKRSAPTIVDEAALQHDTVLVNGGQRGLQIELAPSELVRVVGATVARLIG